MICKVYYFTKRLFDFKLANQYLMRLYNKHTALLLSLCAALAACSDNEVLSDNPATGGETGEKTPIELSVGEATPTTRAVIIDGKGKVTAFENDTRLHLLMVSTNKEDENDKKYTVTYGLAEGSGTPPINVTNPPTASTISFNEETKDVKQTYKAEDGSIVEGYRNPANETVSKNPKESGSKDGIVRYWDDAHARNSVLSIYGFCINGTILPFGAPWNQKIDGIASNTQNIDTTEPKTWKSGAPSSYNIGAEDGSGALMKWNIGDHSTSYNSQTFLSVLYKDDICYSNNISGENCLMYGKKTSGKFDEGVIEFHRAVSLFTIIIKPGQGFDNNLRTNFKFAESKNIEMKGFFKQGYLNLADGSWSDKVLGNWTTICNATAASDSYYTLMAFVIPGNDLNSDTDASEKSAMIFTIDGNEYKLSKQDLLTAIKANEDNLSVDEENNPTGNVKEEYLTDGTKLKAGINYQFTLTVGKTKIDKIKASIVDWKTVTAEAEPDNAHSLTVKMETLAGGSADPAASRLFKSNNEDASKGYSNTYEAGKYATNGYYDLASRKAIQDTKWFWPNNSTYYHFRTISPQQNLTKDGESEKNYLTITGGAIAATNDYVWGAPLKEKHEESATAHPITYSETEGYQSYLYPAIGPTKDDIHITQFHMMSDLEVKLITTTGDDKVVLTGAKVSLVNYASQAKLMIGTGLVTECAGITTTEEITKVTDGADYTWRTVPQSLSRGERSADKVGLKITLTDGNIYEIKDLSTLSVKVNNEATTIPRWEPGKKYVYTLTLKKTAIDHIKATIVDWDTVEATYDNVVIQ